MTASIDGITFRRPLPPLTGTILAGGAIVIGGVALLVVERRPMVAAPMPAPVPALVPGDGNEAGGHG